MGESITDTISVKSADGTSKDVTVTINGTNDIPTINAITAQSPKC
jgi:VCBS repeat-containing protein